MDKKRWWQAHPFALSCASNAQYLRITVKALGDFTSNIGSLKPNTRILLDGPHGAFTHEASVMDKYLLIAGGIGITHIRSLCESLVAEGEDVVLPYGIKTHENLVFMEEMA